MDYDIYLKSIRCENSKEDISDRGGSIIADFAKCAFLFFFFKLEYYSYMFYIESCIVS